MIALYLGEINDQEQAPWRRSLEVFDEEKQQFTALGLFPKDRPLPEDAVGYNTGDIAAMDRLPDDYRSHVTLQQDRR